MSSASYFPDVKPIQTGPNIEQALAEHLKFFEDIIIECS